MEYTVKAERSEFKGQPVIRLVTGDMDKYPFVFGLGKARRILACLDDIKQFVADEEAKRAGEAKSKSVPVK